MKKPPNAQPKKTTRKLKRNRQKYASATVASTSSKLDASAQLPAPVKEEFPNKLVWLPAKDRPPFPGVVSSAMFKLKTSLSGARTVLKSKEPYFALSYLKSEKEDGEFYEIGCVARVLKSARFDENELEADPDRRDFSDVTAFQGNIQGFLIRSLRRIKIERVIQKQPFKLVKVTYFPEDDENVFGLKDGEFNSYLSLIIAKVKELIRLDSVFVEEMKLFIAQHALKSPVLFLNLISGHLTAPSPEELQKLLSIRDLKERMLQTIYYLQKEVEIFNLRKKIDDQVQKEVSKQQRQFFLKEQLKHIKKELGLETDEKTLLLKEFRQKAQTLALSKLAQKVVSEECRKINLYDTRSPEYSLACTYVEWILNLPWNVSQQNQIRLSKIKRTLNKHHYGMDKVKARILEFMAVEKLRSRASGSILCFLGPPGVGKTSLGKSIAEATGRDFYRFSLGGMRDEAEIKGHRRTYVGAMPGKFIQALRSVNALNAVIMLDEIDKIANTFRGDPASALLEVLDKEQNHNFRDHYLDIPFDLSKILFIATANQLETIPAPLLDRMEIVELSGYVLAEKEIIAKRHLIPKIATEHGLVPDALAIKKPVLQEIIISYASESGVRSLEKMLAQIFRKAIYQNLTKEETQLPKKHPNPSKPPVLRKKLKLDLDLKDLKTYLGQKIFKTELSFTQTLPGVVCGLAWTELGGATLYIEAITVKTHAKNETIRLTGNLGDVMMESAELAYSYIRAFLEPKLPQGTYTDFFEKEMHIHVPAGATPKDGPSAGVAMASAMLSVLLDHGIPISIAMTGELTLTGKILPVGGIREKVVAAKRSSKTRIFLPLSNQEDFNEIPPSVRRGLNVTFIDHFEQLVTKIFPKKLFAIKPVTQK